MAMTRELARIKAVQKAYEYRHYGRPTQKTQPLEFKDWLQQGINHYKKQGFSFELVDKNTMKITAPDQTSILRTCKSFKEEYETEYLSKF